MLALSEEMIWPVFLCLEVIPATMRAPNLSPTLSDLEHDVCTDMYCEPPLAETVHVISDVVLLPDNKLTCKILPVVNGYTIHIDGDANTHTATQGSSAQIVYSWFTVYLESIARQDICRTTDNTVLASA